MQQENDAKPDENHGPNRAVRAPCLERIRRSFAHIPGLGSAHRVESHVENKARKQESKQQVCAVAHVAIEADNDRSEDHNVNQRFVVFTVVDGAKSGE